MGEQIPLYQKYPEEKVITVIGKFSFTYGSRGNKGHPT